MGLAAPLALVALGLLLAQSAPLVETVGGQRMGIVLPAAAPRAALLLIPGGSTRMRIDDAGESSNAGNFVMRVRPQLTAHGYALGYVQNPADLRAAIARMRTIARPVVLLATSAGTVVAVRNALALRTDGPDAVVLTSTVWAQSRNPIPPVDRSVGSLTIPVLFVANTNDACFVSEPRGIGVLVASFPAGADVTRLDVTSTERMGPDCEPFSPHGFLGIEDAVVDEIARWIDARAPRYGMAKMALNARTSSL